MQLTTGSAGGCNGIVVELGMQDVEPSIGTVANPSSATGFRGRVCFATSYYLLLTTYYLPITTYYSIGESALPPLVFLTTLGSSPRTGIAGGICPLNPVAGGSSYLLLTANYLLLTTYYFLLPQEDQAPLD